VNLRELLRSIRAFSKRRPFKPYLIQFHSGDEVLVRHPEAVNFRGELVYHVSPAYDYRLFDTTSVCQLLDTEKQAK
jgi:hypothetical protein